jgi:PKD repeat protein
MKNLLLALLLAIGVQGFSQQIVNVAIAVMDTNGLPVANQPITSTHISALGPVTTTGFTNSNGLYLDSALIAPQSSMVYFTTAGGCADSVIFFTNPATFFYTDTLIVCTGTIPCNANFTSQVNGGSAYVTPAMLLGQYDLIIDWGDGVQDTFTPSNPPSVPIRHDYTSTGTFPVCIYHSNASLGCFSSSCDSVTINSTMVHITVHDTTGAPIPNITVFRRDWIGSAIPTPIGVTNSNGAIMDTLIVYPLSRLTYYSSWNGCTDSVYFNSNPISTFYADTLEPCQNGVVSCNYTVSALPVAGFPNRAAFSYSGANPGASSYLWDFGDGNTSTQPNPFHTYNQPGTYLYCLTIDSCPAVCDSITVFGGGGCDPFFFPVVNGNTVDIFPALLTGQFQAIVDWGDGQLDTFTPQNIPVLPANISHTYNAPGNYSICLTHSNATLGCSNTYCDSVSVNSGSSPCQALWTVDTINSINFAGNVVLWNLSTGGTAINPLNYIWDWGDGTTSTGQYPMHSYTDTGVYYVCLTVVDPVSGCMDTHCDSLGFDANGNLVYKNSTFAGFTVVVIDPATIGSDEIDLDAGIDAYPNPSSGMVFIKSDAIPITEVFVFDLSGRMILQAQAANGLTEPIQLNIQNKGMYLVQINTPSGSISKKLLVD